MLWKDACAMGFHLGWSVAELKSPGNPSEGCPTRHPNSARTAKGCLRRHAKGMPNGLSGASQDQHLPPRQHGIDWGCGRVPHGDTGWSIGPRKPRGGSKKIHTLQSMFVPIWMPVWRPSVGLQQLPLILTSHPPKTQEVWSDGTWLCTGPRGNLSSPSPVSPGPF